MILITGATGNLGSKTIDHLINKGVEPSEISAFVRNEEKANDLKAKGVNLVIGDYSDYNQWSQASKGWTSFYLFLEMKWIKETSSMKI